MKPKVMECPHCGSILERIGLGTLDNPIYYHAFHKSCKFSHKERKWRDWENEIEKLKKIKKVWGL